MSKLHVFLHVFLKKVQVSFWDENCDLLGAREETLTHLTTKMRSCLTFADLAIFCVLVEN